MATRFRPLPLVVAASILGRKCKGGRANQEIGAFAAHVGREASQRGDLGIMLKMTPTLYWRLKRAAKRSGTTMATLTRAALRATIEKMEAGAREVKTPQPAHWVKGYWRKRGARNRTN